MESQPRRLYPRCEFHLIPAESITHLLSDRLANREPTSLIRLGDGEGMVLARPGQDSVSLWRRACATFGPQITAPQLESLADGLIDAIDSADVIGIRDDVVDVEFLPDRFDLPDDEFLTHFRDRFHLREVEATVGFQGALRLALLHRFLATRSFDRDAAFTSAWVHFHLSLSGALIRMVASQERIGLISCRRDLAEALERLLQVRVDFFSVPDYVAKVGSGGGWIHFPDRFDELMGRLTVPSRGQLFLVGAGVCGKVYCHRIKELGGIGLDVGSMCDIWLGIASRKLPLRFMFGTDKVPDALLLEHQAKQVRPVFRDLPESAP